MGVLHKMKIYLAAPWVQRDAARETSIAFEVAGHEITEKWWDHVEVDLDDPENHPELERQALKDVLGVASADLIVVLQLEKSEGKAVETGLGLALGKPVLVVGPRGNLFHFLTDFVEVVSDVETAITRINEAVEAARER